MAEIPINKLKVISPMFSYGDRYLEPRPTELKGLIRNTYRIANPQLDLKTLYCNEAKLFGGQLNENGAIVIKASPLRIQILQPQNINAREFLLLHRKAANIPCYPYGTELKSVFTLPESTSTQHYIDIINLSLLLGGIGKRSRRGRGCMTTDELERIEAKDLTNFLMELLNKVGGNENYTLTNGMISLINITQPSSVRPYIKEIHFGEHLSYRGDKVNDYLTNVDNASHEIKKAYEYPYATGSINPRFASSVIVSLAGIKDYIVPVYTVLNAVCENKTFKNAEKEQQDFIRKIEGGRKA